MAPKGVVAVAEYNTTSSDTELTNQLELKSTKRGFYLGSANCLSVAEPNKDITIDVNSTLNRRLLRGDLDSFEVKLLLFITQGFVMGI